jgi:hypothetical protein
MVMKKRVDNMHELYYDAQEMWDSEDFYYLHRYLHRLFYYYKKHIEEIKNMDISKMTESTRVLIYCIIKYYGLDFLLGECENLKELADTKPLKTTLVLDKDPLPEDNIYKQMNVAY